MSNLFIGLILVFGLASCYQTAPDKEFDMSKVLPPDSMVSLLTDLHLADGIISTLKDKKVSVENMASEYFVVILEKHKIDKTIFEESMRYYAYHTEKFDEIYEKVVTNLGIRESIINVAKGEDTTALQ